MTLSFELNNADSPTFPFSFVSKSLSYVFGLIPFVIACKSFSSNVSAVSFKSFSNFSTVANATIYSGNDYPYKPVCWNNVHLSKSIVSSKAACARNIYSSKLVHWIDFFESKVIFPSNVCLITPVYSINVCQNKSILSAEVCPSNVCIGKTVCPSNLCSSNLCFLGIFTKINIFSPRVNPSVRQMFLEWTCLPKCFVRVKPFIEVIFFSSKPIWPRIIIKVYLFV